MKSVIFLQFIILSVVQLQLQNKNLQKTNIFIIFCMERRIKIVLDCKTSCWNGTEYFFIWNTTINCRHMTDGDMKLIIKGKKVGRIELKILEFFFFSLLNYRIKISNAFSLSYVIYEHSKNINIFVVRWNFHRAFVWY